MRPSRPNRTILAATLPAAALGLALGFTLPAGPASADEGVPRLDYEKTCASSGRIQVGISDQDSRDGCLRSEKAAYEDVKKRWNEFTPEAKAQCSKQAEAGGFPSYVETITCLELASGAVPTQSGQDRSAGRGGSTGARGAELTAEPSAKQRVDPIKVLEEKP